MNKRRFIGSATAAAAALYAGPGRAAKPAAAPSVLTLTGALGKSNRPGFDPAVDILMGKHAVTFDKAFALSFEAVAALPGKRFGVTLEYDSKRHELRGPLLTDVLNFGGATLADSTVLTLRAVDGYAPNLKIADARRLGFIVATHRDGVPLALGGLGPLWAVYEADRFPEVMAKPVNERFGSCPWALYHIDIRAG